MSHPKTKHTRLTTEAFRELVETALLDVYEHADTYETAELQDWQGRLKRAIAETAEHNESGDVDVIDRAAAE